MSNTKKPHWFDKTFTQHLTSLKKSVFDKKAKDYLSLWKGEQQEARTIVAGDLTPTQQYERLLYVKGAEIGLNGGVEKSEFAKIFPDVDLNNSEDWVLSLDGTKVVRAEDYYTGNMKIFDALHKQAIDNAETDQEKARLLQQWQKAENRIVRANVYKMDFPINTPFVSNEQKVEWLNRFITHQTTGTKGAFFIAEDGSVQFDKSNGSTFDTDEQAVYARLAIFINKRSFSGGSKDRELNKKRLAMLSDLINRCNSSFSAFVQNSPALVERIENRVNARENLQFKRLDNSDQIAIEGIKPDFKPRKHQAAFVRNQMRHFGGICGYDVGLGKTYSALLAAQHAQSIGVKNKTLFVVPNSTFTNWRKEAKQIYTEDVFARCLFVGLEEKNGEFRYQSKSVENDLIQIQDNQHDKIFMTNEAFEGISLKTKTMEDYLNYVRLHDPNFAESQNATQDTKRKGKESSALSTLKNSMKYNQFLEEMGIDSLVIDEAHYYKNAKTGKFGGRVKWLAISETTKGAANALAKSWYIRGLSKKNDGVLLLTATPITNSPMEIYSMLSLAVGEHQVAQLTGCYGPNEFLVAFCDTEYRLEMTATGSNREEQVFIGLRSLPLLRKALTAVADIKSVDDLPEMANLVPNAEELETDIEIPQKVKDKLDRLKDTYLMAANVLNSKAPNPVEAMQIAQIAQENGETIELLAHPFNFINKTNMLLLDEDLANDNTVFYVPFDQYKEAQSVVDKFNKLKLKDTVNNLIGKELEQVIVQRTETDDEGEIIRYYYEIAVQAILSDNKITLNSSDYSIVQKFIDIADKAKLALDVSLSPKMAALIENINSERSMPKSEGVAKQIIFSDLLGSHHKIKCALMSKANISGEKIAIINAKAVSDPADMQAIQDGFNAFGEENRYEIVIANKKAEVGINLQKGCQAIHHLTVGWTPDSLQQRNGRGVRQGNTLESVNVYQYDVDGTFDKYRRKLINNKGNWINSLMYGDSDKIRIDNDENAMSKTDLEAMANAFGDSQAMRELDSKRAENALISRQSNARKLLELVVRNVKMFEQQRVEIESYENFVWSKYVDLITAFDLLRELKNKKSTLSWKAEYHKNDPEHPDVKKWLKEKAKIDARWQVAMHKNAKLIEDFDWNREEYQSDLHYQMRNQLIRRIEETQKDTSHPYYAQWENELSGINGILERENAQLQDLAILGDIDEHKLTQIRQGKYVIVKQCNHYLITEGDLVEAGGKHYIYIAPSFYDALSFCPIYNEEKILDPYQSKARAVKGPQVFAANIQRIIPAGSALAHPHYQQMAESDQKKREQGWADKDLWSYFCEPVKNFMIDNI